MVHLGDERWWDDELGRWRNGSGRWVRRMPLPHGVVDRACRTRVVLSTCHRDHDPMNNDPANLATWCQRCHVLYDLPGHLRRRRVMCLARRPLGDMFTGPYQEA